MMSSALTDYIEVCDATAVYPAKNKQNLAAIDYCTLGLLGEAGEIANKLKKVHRGDSDLTDDIRATLRAELGDVIWYATRLAHELGSDLASVMGENANKLLARQGRGTLRGSGDER